MPSHRYTAVAILLHWAIAIAIFGMIPLGWWMHEALEDGATRVQATAAYQLHKSIGLTVLMLSLVRLGWRLGHKPPPYPPHMPPWERIAAKATHWAFYALIILMPLTGWLYVSTGWSSHYDRPFEVPTLYFGLFQVPHLFGLASLGDDTRSFLAKTIGFTHSRLAWVMIGLAVIHVAAALKHHLFDQDQVLARMVPGLKPLAGETPTPPPERHRGLILLVGGALIALATIGASYAFLAPPVATPEMPGRGRIDAPHETVAPEAPTEAAPPPAATPHEFGPGDPGAPPLWRVDHARSTIEFAGAHAQIPFRGRFERWRAEIRFDPERLGDSVVLVTIETGSARDGVPLHDETLPQQEWFDVANHPTATFLLTNVRTLGGGRYASRGVVTMKGEPFDVDMPFTLTIQGDRAVMDGRAEIDRASASLGMASDPDAEFVSPTIDVIVHVEAQRTP